MLRVWPCWVSFWSNILWLPGICNIQSNLSDHCWNLVAQSVSKDTLLHVWTVWNESLGLSWSKMGHGSFTSSCVYQCSHQEVWNFSIKQVLNFQNSPCSSDRPGTDFGSHGWVLHNMMIPVDFGHDTPENGIIQSHHTQEQFYLDVIDLSLYSHGIQETFWGIQVKLHAELYLRKNQFSHFRWFQMGFYPQRMNCPVNIRYEGIFSGSQSFLVVFCEGCVISMLLISSSSHTICWLHSLRSKPQGSFHDINGIVPFLRFQDRFLILSVISVDYLCNARWLFDH